MPLPGQCRLPSHCRILALPVLTSSKCNHTVSPLCLAPRAWHNAVLHAAVVPPFTGLHRILEAAQLHTI